MISWTDSQDTPDWRALETLYRLAPLGRKRAVHLLPLPTAMAILENQEAAIRSGHLGAA